MSAKTYATAVVPHLSVGQVPERAEAQALRETPEASWGPLSFTATTVQLIWRGEPPDDIFRTADVFPLGTAEPHTA